MKLPLPVFIGLRYTRSKRRNQFISFVSGFSLLGMTLGTIALIVVMSVMNGFDREIKQRLLQVIPHMELMGDEGVENWPGLQSTVEQQSGIVAAAPYVNGDAMVSFERGMQGIQLRGLLPKDVSRLSGLADHMILGSMDDLREGEYGIVLGRLLARYLGVTPGDKVSVTLPQLSVTPMGIYPRIKRFTVVGVFEVGAQVDQRLVITHLSDAQKLFRLGSRVSGIEARTRDMYGVDGLAQQLWQALSDEQKAHLTLRKWTETQGSLFSAVKMEKTVVSVLLMIIIAVAAFNIISSLVLMVADKRFDIAVLRTLGLTRKQVMGVFMVQGAAIGWFGVLIGCVAGSLIAINVGTIVSFFESLIGVRVFDPSVYFISHMPSVLLASDVAIVVAVGLVMSLVSTLYPAYRASQVEPAEALRYE
ncbi:lipoprotein-releasing ABC transporter permease subunit [Aestuariicella hydrocarbonica]|uniref:Lipoprotein-releasing ABC transporter permease subunit n=1 Tax=Pseudomaricurvus hydrocarbonicus TaxID=1470433 RepID=A0A9E5MPM1_9GAMM|nr:lipoprotein-releasing ABC transporter permease subunit [Aestuariicella hydrocarbonica]NHO68039.1 lipoprotein-releasing ABC transporter permease subunit [Aestuariicella hydrocarbonica]